MTIRKAEGIVTDQDIGKFACPESIMRNGICAGPWQITNVSESSVYLRLERKLRNSTEVDVEEKYVQAKSMVFVCDTIEEGESLLNLTMAQLDALSEAEKAIKADFVKKLQELIDTKSQDSL